MYLDLYSNGIVLLITVWYNVYRFTKNVIEYIYKYACRFLAVGLFKKQNNLIWFSNGI